MVPLRNNVLLPFIGEAFDEAGEPKNPITNLALSILLDDLSWWGEALKSARAIERTATCNGSPDGSTDRGRPSRGCRRRHLSAIRLADTRSRHHLALTTHAIRGRRDRRAVSHRWGSSAPGAGMS